MTTAARRCPNSNPQSAAADTCFQDRLLIRPDDFRPMNQAPGVGIEPTASWFSSVFLPPSPLLPRYRSAGSVALPTATTPDRLWINDTTVLLRFAFQLGEKDLNLHLLLQRQVAYH